MYKIKILSINKTKEPWLQQAIQEYSRRLRPILSIQWEHPKDNDQLDLLLSKEKSYIALDPQGESLTSEAFSGWLMKTLELEHCRLTFVIGGAEGLSQAVLQGAKKRLSLSKLTFTHQMARLLLVEQIYRATEIARGSSYHK
jgi:23S rRNA (pseudouridine1915-N3)-methyltransferase